MVENHKMSIFGFLVGKYPPGPSWIPAVFNVLPSQYLRKGGKTLNLWISQPNIVLIKTLCTLEWTVP